MINLELELEHAESCFSHYIYTRAGGGEVRQSKVGQGGVEGKQVGKVSSLMLSEPHP